jgi:hypothetical protein
MPPAGLGKGTYLGRARSLCARGEALGGSLVTWCAALLAIAWDTDSLEEAILLGASVLDESIGAAHRWAGGMSEGELEPLAADGARMQLAWGEAIVAAESLARVALPGEVLVDGEVRALRAGQLALLGSRAAVDGGRRVRGWRLDVSQPWRSPVETGIGFSIGAEATDPHAAVLTNGANEVGRGSPEATQETDAIEFSVEEPSTAEVIEIIEASAAEAPEPKTSDGAAPPEHNQTMERVRTLVDGGHPAEAGEVLADLRRLRARADEAPASTRCQTALALAMTLAIAGRPEEALLDTLEALARAREAQDPKALRACTALLVKLYAAAGRGEEAAALRESE